MGGTGTWPSVLTCLRKVSIYKRHFLKEEKKERKKIKSNTNNSKCG